MKDRTGESVIVNGKTFTIVGTHKRSYLVEDTMGCRYTITPSKLDRAKGMIDEPDGLPEFFKNEMNVCKVFKREFTKPTAENAIEWASAIYNQLSPENLTCDGELSRTRANARRRMLNFALAYVFKVAGRVITEDEAFEYDMKRIEEQRANYAVMQNNREN